MTYVIKVLKKTKKPEWLKIDSPQLKQFNVIIGWDTEYRNKDWKIDLQKYNITKTTNTKKQLQELDKQRTKNSLYNDVISYQFVVYSKEKDCYLELIIYLYQKDQFFKRLTLSNLIGIVLENLGYEWSEIKEKKILLTAHFSVAEFTALAYSDREPLIKHLKAVQKTISSYSFFPWPVQKYASFSNIQKSNIPIYNVQLLWRDTILLAPQGYKSLKKIATTTTHEKLDLTPEEYIDMISLLTTNEKKYEEYAINDAIVTLEFFCNFMDVYYFTTTNQLVKKIPLTAVGSSELHYLARLEEESLMISADRNYLRKLVFGLKKDNSMINSRENDESFVNYCYLGGRNNISRYYSNFNGLLNNRLFLDVDFRDAYSCAFGVIVLPNWNERIRNTISTEKYAKDLAQQHNKELAFTKMGFFEIDFNFSEEIYEPILPQKTKWGLIYTQSGTTRSTFPELMEGERLQAVQKVHELVLYDEQLINGQVFYPFANYIKLMTAERNKWPKNSFENLLYKLQKNGLYGKTGQGIEIREFFSLEGKKDLLKPSRITCAEYASHITGIIRTALGVVINEIEAFPGCEVIHWTTDGLVFSIPWDYKKINLTGKNLENIKLEDLNPQLMEKLNNLRIIRLLKFGAEKIGLDNNWIAIKGFGDNISSLTTRGNWMTWKGETTGLARGNLGSKIIKTAEDFQRYAENDEIIEIAIENLVNIQEIIKKKFDLVIRYNIEKGKRGKKIYRQSFRKINLGPDGKRKVDEDGINTKPFKDVNEAAKYRATIEYMTKKEIRKSTQNIVWQTKIAQQKKIRGSREETIYRTLIGLVLQENLQDKKTYYQLTEMINEWKIFKRKITVQDLKNWKHRRILIKSVPKEGFWAIYESFSKISKIVFPKKKLEDFLF